MLGNLTREFISERFLEQIHDSADGKLTVQELTRRCGMSRNTFYYYYDSIQSLLTKTILEWLDSPEPEDGCSLQECIEPVMHDCLNHRREMIRLANGSYRREVMTSIVKVLERNLLHYVRGKIQKEEAPQDSESLLVSFFVRMTSGFFDWWFFKKSMDTKSAAQVQTFVKILSDQFASGKISISNLPAEFPFEP